MSYRVEFTTSAAKELRKLRKTIQPKLMRNIADRVHALAVDPRPPGVEKVENAGDLWRVRAGDYRIVYSIEDEVLTVLVVRIGHRREVYKKR